MSQPVGEAEIRLRDVVDDDVAEFFDHQQDLEANWMAAFPSKDPSDRESFMRHWKQILRDDSIRIQTVLVNDAVAGHVLTYDEEGRREVSYWFGRRYWGQGIATKALGQFLSQLPSRPLHARVARDNTGSRRVLEHCGFVVVGPNGDTPPREARKSRSLSCDSIRRSGRVRRGTLDHLSPSPRFA